MRAYGALALVALFSSSTVMAETSLGFGTRPAIAAQDRKFGVVSGPPLEFYLLDESGNKLNYAQVLIGGYEPDIAAADSVWAAAIDGVYLIVFDDSGNMAFPMLQVSTKTPVIDASQPSVVWTGSAYAVAWVYQPNSSVDYMDIAIVDTSGNFILPDTTVVSGYAYPQLAYDPQGGFGLTWQTSSGPPYGVYPGVNVSFSGSPVGTIEWLSPSNQRGGEYGRVASCGGCYGFGVVINDLDPPNPSRTPYFTPLDADMDPIAAPIQIDTGYHEHGGGLVFTGSAFFWAVEYWDGTHMEEYFYRLRKDGTLLGAKQRLTTADSVIQGGTGEYGPRAAMGTRAVGVVWEDYRDCLTCLPSVYFQSVATVELLVGGGAGAANPAEVRSRSAFKGEPVLAFAPYAAGYGCNVGAGNVDAQPLEEILTGPGPGPAYGPQVRAFTGGEEALSKVNFYAYGTLKYGVHAQGGDIDGDGFAEILTSPGPGAVFGPHIRAFNYDGTSVSPVSKVSFYAYGTLKYGAEVASADVDADGYAEIVTGPGPGAVFGAHLRGFDYDNATVQAIRGINTLAFTGKYGLLVGGGDVNGDGAGDLLVSPGPDPAQPGVANVLVYSSGKLSILGTIWPNAGGQGGAHVASADMDLDSAAEVVATPCFLPGNGAFLHAYRFTGSGFQRLPAFDQDVFPGLGYGASCAVGNVGI